MSKVRMALDENELEQVVGGFIEYKFSNSRGYGLCWINQEDDPEAAKVRYKFTDLDALKDFFDKNYGKYGDYGILPKAVEAGLCELYN